MLKKLIFTGLLIQWACYLKAQFDIKPVFQHLTSESFGANIAHTQQWDKLGRVWMICDQGILVHDGYSSKIISKSTHPKSGLLATDVRYIYLDSQEKLWITYSSINSVTQLDVHTNQYLHFFPDSTNKKSIPDALTVRLFEDSEKRLYFAFWGGGIAEFNRKSQTFFTYSYQPSMEGKESNLPFHSIKGIAEVQPGVLLLGFFGEGKPEAFPCYFNQKNKTFKKFPVDEFLIGVEEREKKCIRLALTIVNFIHVDKNQNIWFGTYCGMIFFDMKNKTCRRVSPRKFDSSVLNLDNVRSCIEDSDGVLWVATPNKGVLAVNTNDFSSCYLYHDVDQPGSVADNRIASVRLAPDNNIWISTGTGGISLYCKYVQQFKVFPWSSMDLDYTLHSEQSVPVNQVLVRDEEHVYVSSENGISIFNSRTATVDQKIFNKVNFKTNEGSIKTARIESFKFLSDHEIIMIKAGKLTIYNTQTKQFRVIEYKNNFKKNIWADGIFLRHDPKLNSKEIFVAKLIPAYVLKFDLKSQRVDSLLSFRKYFNEEDYENSVKFSDKFSAILPSGKILFSAAVGRFSQGALNRFVIFNPTTGLGHLYGSENCDKYFPDSTISNVYVDPQKKIWITTENGLYQFDENTGLATHMNEKIGLPPGPVRAVIVDKKGLMWLALEKYIACWNREQNKVFIYKNELGMPSGTFLPAVAQMDEKGKIYIATSNGLLKFNPAKLVMPDDRPILRLSTLLVGEKPLTHEELNELNFSGLSFNWNENFLHFEFATNQIYAPVPHKFFYRLLGMDTSWQANGSSNKIKYTNLSHGEYTLEVKVINGYAMTSKVLRIHFTIKRPFWLAWWFYIICFLIVGLIVYAYIRYREAKLRKTQELLEQKVEERTAEVVEKAREITLQKEIIEEKNKELTDSIHYAERIQRSILPDEKAMSGGLPQHFVLFKPKDIVSGDFYWYTQHHDYILWAVVDCTGHGVPGGFMSMLGSGLLNQIVNEEKKFQPDIILNELRDRVIIALKQTGTIGENRDGMDISLCCYHLKSNELSYAGANNAAYVVRNGELHELSPDKQPIGIYTGEKKNFTPKTFQLQKNDCIYMTSDGYPDQFGGPKGKKFKTSNFEKLVQQVSIDSIEEQLMKINQTFENWKHDFEQLDDVCVFGVKV